MKKQKILSIKLDWWEKNLFLNFIHRDEIYWAKKFQNDKKSSTHWFRFHFSKNWLKKMDFHPSRWVILGEKGMIWTKKHQNLQWMLHFYLSAMIQAMKIRYLKKVVIQKSKNISLSEITCIITYQIVKPITMTLRSNLSLLEKVVFRFMPLNGHLYIWKRH